MTRTWAPRPDFAFVGNHTYSIEWVDSGEFADRTDRNDADGVTFDSRNLILVRTFPNAYESHYQEVLMHELTHAVWGATKLTHAIEDVLKAEDKEESIVLLQTPGLLFLLKQNPHLVKYLMADGNEQR